MLDSYIHAHVYTHISIYTLLYICIHIYIHMQIMLVIYRDSGGSRVAFSELEDLDPSVLVLIGNSQRRNRKPPSDHLAQKWVQQNLVKGQDGDPRNLSVLASRICLPLHDTIQGKLRYMGAHVHLITQKPMPAYTLCTNMHWFIHLAHACMYIFTGMCVGLRG